MIVTDLSHLAEQASLTPGLQKALAFLQRPETRELLEGKHEIDGNAVYAVVQTGETRADAPEWVFEGHRRYIDIQYMVQGEMVIGWAPTARALVKTPYDPERDVWLGTVPAKEIARVRVAAGQLAVLYPSDAHSPKQSVQLPKWIKKIVVKVAL